MKYGEVAGPQNRPWSALAQMTVIFHKISVILQFAACEGMLAKACGILVSSGQWHPK